MLVKYLRNKKIITIATLLLIPLAIVASLYMGRGWLRGPAISWLTTRIYAPQVNTAFEQYVAPVNERLSKLSLTSDYSSGARCYDRNFDGIRETLGCYRQENLVKQDVFPLLSSWPQESDHIEKLLADGGWSTAARQAYTNYPISDDLSNLLDDSRPQVELHYHKRVGKIECYLWFNYAPGPGSLRVQSNCGRLIKIFGGHG